jgi:hypothetical protein
LRFFCQNPSSQTRVRNKLVPVSVAAKLSPWRRLARWWQATRRRAGNGAPSSLRLEYARARTLSAETIAATRLPVIKHGALTTLAAGDPEVAGELFALTTHELRRARISR